MAMNVCPVCSNVTLSIGSESSLKCSTCETVFEIDDRSSDDTETRTKEE